MTSERAGDVVRWVHQKHARGCGVAALAMVTGRTYDDVLDDFAANHPSWEPNPPSAGRDLDNVGLYNGDDEWFLARHGFAWRALFRGWKVEPWPPAPFADRHIVRVRQTSGSSHFVVLLGDGTVLDPLDHLPTVLAAWPTVDAVMGVYDVSRDDVSRVPDTAESRSVGPVGDVPTT